MQNSVNVRKEIKAERIDMPVRCGRKENIPLKLLKLEGTIIY